VAPGLESVAPERGSRPGSIAVNRVFRHVDSDARKELDNGPRRHPHVAGETPFAELQQASVTEVETREGLGFLTRFLDEALDLRARGEVDLARSVLFPRFQGPRIRQPEEVEHDASPHHLAGGDPDQGVRTVLPPQADGRAPSSLDRRHHSEPIDEPRTHDFPGVHGPLYHERVRAV
jgi:hypothetical protein